MLERFLPFAVLCTTLCECAQEQAAVGPPLGPGTVEGQLRQLADVAFLLQARCS